MIDSRRQGNGDPNLGQDARPRQGDLAPLGGFIPPMCIMMAGGISRLREREKNCDNDESHFYDPLRSAML